MNMIAPQGIAPVEDAVEVDAVELVDMLLDQLEDGLDHPELWPDIGIFAGAVPGFIDALFLAYGSSIIGRRGAHALALIAIARGAEGRTSDALTALETVGASFSQSPLIQGATFHVQSLRDPGNPKFDLKGRICGSPFHQMDVLDGSTHLCCASWLGTSIGNLAQGDWRDTWNSDVAQAIRASVHDGSYRYCNKITCPRINDGSLDTAAEMAARSPEWRRIVEDQATVMERGPDVVNLAYDQTCNLSCPSCRVAKIASDRPTRERFAELQGRCIKPMLKDARLAVVTGSGDPFASKNFRTLMEELTPADYPDLRFRIMTNGMLLNRREWDRFPSLHGRVEKLRVSLDAATGPTHEALRRGARWDVMVENMAFFGELLRDGQVESYELTCVVQQENYREMGDLVDLAHAVGANIVYYGRVTNWGTYSDEAFAALAVCSATHPEHGDFLEAMRDPRLRDPIVILGDLTPFLPDETYIAA